LSEAIGSKLAVLQMEKAVVLHTAVTPKAGDMYWTIFANIRSVENVGSRVDAVIGDLHVSGLTMDSK
jgi:hypothetical protein